MRLQRFLFGLSDTLTDFSETLRDFLRLFETCSDFFFELEAAAAFLTLYSAASPSPAPGAAQKNSRKVSEVCESIAKSERNL